VDAERRHVMDLASDAGRLRRSGDTLAVLDDFDGLEVVVEGARAGVGVTV
jgi:hypothetical protein